MDNLKAYLGDGLYAEFDHDGHEVRLWCQRDRGIHEVFLDWHVMTAFMGFLSKASKAKITFEYESSDKKIIFNEKGS